MGVIKLVMPLNRNDDLFWMNLAYQQAKMAKEQGEVPVGAVLVSDEGELLAVGSNAVENTFDPCAHAELIAIRHASYRLKNHRLLNTSLYVTLEPCVMCAGALIHARVRRLIYATRDFKAGAAGSIYNLLAGHPLNHRVQIDEGLMQEECALLLSDFFKSCREKN